MRSLFLFEKEIANSEEIAEHSFIKVYCDDTYEENDINCRNYIQSIFIPNDSTIDLDRYSWIANIGELGPGFINSSNDKYFIWGNEHSIVPIVYQKFYNNIYPTEYKVLEEFILFFNLYEDFRDGNFYSINSNSDKKLVIKYNKKSNSFEISTFELRQFLSIKDYTLIIQFDYFRDTDIHLSEYDINIDNEFQIKTKNGNFLINFNEYTVPNKHYDSRLLGKCHLTGYRDYRYQENSFFKRKLDDDYLNFITGIDENGVKMFESCGITKLDTNYYKIVSFERSVLQRYYNSPDLYTIDDGIIIKKGSWRLYIDNNNFDSIKVYLGDLGILEKSEQNYWLSYNILSSSKLSEVQYRRDILAIPFLDPEMPDLLFRKYYRLFSNRFNEEFRFPIFKSLHELDTSYLNIVRVPLTEDLIEFEKIILSLSKILCDAINIKAINKFHETEEMQKINALKIFCANYLTSEEEFISALESIQSLRSQSIAHNKDNRYEKLLIRLGFSNLTYSQIICKLLNQITTALIKWHKILK